MGLAQIEECSEGRYIGCTGVRVHVAHLAPRSGRINHWLHHVRNKTSKENLLNGADILNHDITDRPWRCLSFVCNAGTTLPREVKFLLLGRARVFDAAEAKRSTTRGS